MTNQAVMLRLPFLADKAGVRPLTPHDLRRSFVAGADISSVPSLVGHLSVDTIQHYDRRPEDAKRNVAEKLHVPFIKPPLLTDDAAPGRRPVMYEVLELLVARVRARGIKNAFLVFVVLPVLAAVVIFVGRYPWYTERTLFQAGRRRDCHCPCGGLFSVGYSVEKHGRCRHLDGCVAPTAPRMREEAPPAGLRGASEVEETGDP